MPLALSNTSSVTVAVNTVVTGRMVFYNNSSFDAISDDAAIASDKTALLPGDTASFANYTSFSSGLNGIMIDIRRLANLTGLTATDFTFKVGNNNTPFKLD